jgi:hypothetical protein
MSLRPESQQWVSYAAPLIVIPENIAGLTLPRALVFTPRGPQEWVSTIVSRYQRRLRQVNTAGR